MPQYIVDGMGCLWLVCMFVAVFGCIYASYAGLLAARFALRPDGVATPLRGTPAPAPVSLIKPLHGRDPDLHRNLTTFCTQSYPAPLQIVFGLNDAADPAADVVRALIREHPQIAIELVCNAARHGENPKISNVINIMTAVRHDIVILSDSDISVSPDYVSAIAAHLQQPGVGLVTCLYRGHAVGGFWSRLAAAAVDQHFLPSVLVGTSLGLAKPCFGSTIALTAETLSRIGGFAAFADVLADDYEIGRAVRNLGLTIAIPRFVVGHTFAERSLAELLAHELRWTRTIRLVDPVGFAGSVATHPLPFALAAVVLSGYSALSLALLVVTVASRLFVSYQVARMCGTSRDLIWLSPLRDLLSFAVFVASYLPGSVSWRGRRYAIRADGTLRPL